MQIDIFDILHQSETLALFVCIALGYWLGNLSIGRLQLGAGGGVLLVGIVFGHYGFQANPIVGTVGLMMLIKLMPSWLRIDMPAEALAFARERGYDDAPSASSGQRPVTRIYEIAEDEFVGSRIRDLSEALREDEVALRIKRGEEMFEPDADFVIERGDRFSLLATPDRHRRLRERFGVTQDIMDEDLLASDIDVEEVILTEKQAAGKPLSMLGINDRYGCFLTGIRRSQIELPLTDSTTTQIGDVLTVTGAMTSTPALGVVQEAAKSPIPALGYAGTYAFANILLTMAGAAIMLT